jgi:hypothetical protein
MHVEFYLGFPCPYVLVRRLGAGVSSVYIVTYHFISAWNDQIRDAEMVGARSMHGRSSKYTQNCSRKTLKKKIKWKILV